MASPLATKRLQRELKALHKNPLTHPKITAQPNESNILEWHYVLEGPADDPKSPYKGGIYHGKLVFPKEYPYKVSQTVQAISMHTHCINSVHH